MMNGVDDLLHLVKEFRVLRASPSRTQVEDARLAGLARLFRGPPGDARRWLRADVEISVRVTAHGETAGGVVRNLSAGGALLVSPLPLVDGEPVLVQGEGGERLAARALRHTQSGIALSFD
jgi:hypothetical protein